MDFKKGVEFKCYASNRLPHARVVAIESDREFGLSVLQRVDDELKRRGDLFRKLGVQDIAGYKRAGGTEPIPRSLLIIDEFQEFFVEDDKISQTASLLLDRIVRQGRAFGIHVLLGSQTLGGAYTVARTTLGQMVIRIALQCNEADAYLIMDDNNPAPAPPLPARRGHLQRHGRHARRQQPLPGGLAAGSGAGDVSGEGPGQGRPGGSPKSEGRSPKSRRPTAGRAIRGRLSSRATRRPTCGRTRCCAASARRRKSLKPAAAGRIWLGAPNSIKGPTEAAFQRQSGNNLLVVGQREEAIARHHVASGWSPWPPSTRSATARFILCDGTAPGTSAARVPRPRSPSHSAPDHAGQAGRPGRTS